MSVVGIDACKRGWIAMELGDGATGHFVDKLDNLSPLVPDAQTIAIDIPIGLPAEGRRQADVAARELLGPRRSSVFFTPVREALLAPTHAEASAIAKDLTGHGVSQQAYALSPKILEAEQWAASSSVPSGTSVARCDRCRPPDSQGFPCCRHRGGTPARRQCRS